MISLKVLSTVAAMALLVPVVTPSESFAQGFGQNGKAGGGGVARSGGGGGAARMGGGGPRFSGGGGGGGGGGGVYRGGYRRGGGGGGFIPGAVAGALVGGALVGGYGYGYGPGYYDDQYYDDGAVAVAPAQAGDDGVAYCIQTYRSYDVRSGTYLGNDGFRHDCP